VATVLSTLDISYSDIVVKLTGPTDRRTSTPTTSPATLTCSAPGSAIAVLPPWAEQVTECCQLRCPSLVERVEQAGPAPQRLLLVLEGGLDQLVAAGDGPGAATLLSALLPLVEHLEPRQGRHEMRDAVLAWDVRSVEQPERLPRGI